MNKHAYLIIAHKCSYNLQILLHLIDDCRNDIFIHMDKKNIYFSENNLKKNVKNSNLYFVERTSVTWGAYSLVNAELLLLKKATSTGKYLYYHLLSGDDLPLKTQDYIHDFFEKNSGYEFISFQKSVFERFDRVKYIYPFQEKVGNKNNVYRLLDYFFIKIQKFFHYSNSKCNNVSF